MQIKNLSLNLHIFWENSEKKFFNFNFMNYGSKKI